LLIYAGTSDEHLSLLEHLAPVQSKLSAVVVTTPQAVALVDAMKCISFTRAANLPILGLIENMSGYACPCCGEITNVFSTGGGQDLAHREKLRFLGSLPIDTELVTILDGEDAVSRTQEGSHFPLLTAYSRTPSAKVFGELLQVLLPTLSQGEGAIHSNDDNDDATSTRTL
jgi:MinD-like ATPase involved in chromosome partitioning or flagellar assembly